MTWRFEREPPSRFWTTGVLSLALHGIGAYGLTTLPDRPLPKEPETLRIQLISQGEPAEDDQTSAPDVAKAAPETTKPVEAPPTPAPPTPKPTPAPTPAPPAETVAAPSPLGTLPMQRPTRPTAPSPPTSFAQFRQRRMSSFVPNTFQTFGGHRGTDRSHNNDRDRCEPFPHRRLQRLYLLYDTSGSMVGQLEDQALRCAHQYASAALEQGADVVVGNFAGYTTLFPPTRDRTTIGAALRDDNDHTATVLPSTELYRYFDQDPTMVSDLVILSDGYIPNIDGVAASYSYFLDLNADNRGYLYTLGAKAHPQVTDQMQDLGFDVYVYRVF